jgi:hypothetical protein
MQAIKGANFGNRFLDIVVKDDIDQGKSDTEDNTLLKMPTMSQAWASFLMSNIVL